jgi:hypothetical protein
MFHHALTKVAWASRDSLLEIAFSLLILREGPDGVDSRTEMSFM